MVKKKVMYFHAIDACKEPAWIPRVKYPKSCPGCKQYLRYDGDVEIAGGKAIRKPETKVVNQLQ